MKTSLLVIVSLFIVAECFSQKIKPGSKIIVDNPRIYEIIPENAKIEILAEGFEWTEGPLWLEKENKLIFSDIPPNSIFEWTEKSGVKLYMKPSGYTNKKPRGGEVGSNGLLLSPEGDLILCQHGDRRIAKMTSSIKNPKAEFETLSDSYKGKKLNSPNDAVYSKNGNLYFTDPPYGLELNMEDPTKEIDSQGVYKLNKNGEVTLLTKELSRPNGIAFSPDESKLYVANSDPEKAIWMVYDVTNTGLIENGKVFYDVTDKTKTLKGLPDGMKVHPKGWIFATGPGGVLIFTPEGEHLGTIFTGEATANCTFNHDYSVLYMTADDYLLRVKLRSQK
ncbi:MAG: SMP-30/gluconolactonase/LRE family protein [Bacteroidetes bacterium]|nr:SMP-30/gluconolactonase/LRE family protein [Bacteroidota bacterium]